MLSLSDLAARFGAELVLADKSVKADKIMISGIASLDLAKENEVSFLTSSAYEKYLKTTKAAAVIVAARNGDVEKPQLVFKNPYLLFAKIAQFFEVRRKENGKVSEMAYVAKSAQIGDHVTVYPHAYIGEGAVVEKDAVIFSGVFVGDCAVVGAGSVLHPNVVLGERCRVGARVIVHGGTVIGADGFGFVPAPEENTIVKIPQTGIVVLEDDVEVGSGTTIDRATIGETRIGRGTKIDSSVHVAHNVHVGEHCFLCGHVGIAGSARLGNWVVLAGHSGVNNHVEIADGVQLAAMGGITKNISEAGQYMGFPALPANEWRRQQAYQKRIPRLEEKIKKLEEQLKELKR